MGGRKREVERRSSPGFNTWVVLPNPEHVSWHGLIERVCMALNVELIREATRPRIAAVITATFPRWPSAVHRRI